MNNGSITASKSMKYADWLTVNNTPQLTSGQITVGRVLLQSDVDVHIPMDKKGNSLFTVNGEAKRADGVNHYFIMHIYNTNTNMECSTEGDYAEIIDGKTVIATALKTGSHVFKLCEVQKKDDNHVAYKSGKNILYDYRTKMDIYVSSPAPYASFYLDYNAAVSDINSLNQKEEEFRIYLLKRISTYNNSKCNRSINL